METKHAVHGEKNTQSQRGCIHLARVNVAPLVGEAQTGPCWQNLFVPMAPSHVAEARVIISPPLTMTFLGCEALLRRPTAQHGSLFPGSVRALARLHRHMILVDSRSLAIRMEPVDRAGVASARLEELRGAQGTAGG
ncbi:hypothetical protein SKAU_G00285670 [Synaphobranchus kaupii]|uniref:Uncharacterized protein n=1 Tax=Synaphobranchus kaupii TaxID=118154 RepID=A0A9Q1EXZ6_SYNKA|nr:hypothetical protein SKAU_G00285670 [Synaphobranchus kaupii]